MPHLIDKETGLCEICNRLEIAAIKEGKKYKRQVYDVRKLAIDKITHKEDPNYRNILNRHYVKYKDTLKQENEPIKYTPQNTFTKKLPVNAKLAKEVLSNDNKKRENRDLISVLEDRSKSKNETRETLRKVNLAQVSRLNKKFVSSEPNVSYQQKKSVIENKIYFNYDDVDDDDYENDSFQTDSKGYNLISNEYNVYDKNRIESDDDLIEPKFQVLNKKPSKKKIIYHHHYEDENEDFRNGYIENTSRLYKPDNYDENYQF